VVQKETAVAKVASTKSEGIDHMNEQIRKLRKQLRISQISAQQLQGENELLKDIQEDLDLSPQQPMTWTRPLRSVVLIDENLADPSLVYRTL
jgi:GTPase Era involved in 16S rRNA processing